MPRMSPPPRLPGLPRRTPQMLAAWPLALLLLVGLAPGGATAQAARPTIEKAADLPRFTYTVSGSVESLVRSAEAFAPFAAAVRRDAESVLAGYDIADKATRRELLSMLAVLDYLDGRLDQAQARADEVRALQDKPADKLLSGLRLRAMIAAAREDTGGRKPEAFARRVGERITQELAGYPYPVIANDVKSYKASAELIGEGLVLGQVREVLQPMVDKARAISSEFAPNLVQARMALTEVLPLKRTLIDTYSRYLAANQVDKPDIWAARDVNFSGMSGLTPVTLAVWDSGVDTALFKDQVLRDAQGRARVIAFDKYSRPSRGELMPIPAALQAKLPQMTARTKGFSDLQSNVDSPEASALKQTLSALPQDQYKPLVEEINLAGNHEHGTHVAGISLAGNPAARLLVARLEYGHTLVPDPCPSLALAKREAKAFQATVDFMKRAGARVANMSWGGSIVDIEGQLEQCGIGRSPEDRKARARAIFEIGKRSLSAAMASAPSILFVAAAGNSNNDASFVESIPAGINLPNLLTVGAVDRAGDEAPFTSYGPTVKVHANGYQVESYLPGGARVALSGTSMAAPQVSNLAAKLLAVKPSLQPKDLVRVIVETAEPSADGRRRLVHPAKALAAVKGG